MGMNGNIFLISNSTSGSSSKQVQIAEGMTAQEAIYADLGTVDLSKRTVLVNGTLVEEPSEYVLSTGDFVVVSPKNLKGAV